MDVHNKLKFSGTWRSVKRIIYMEFSQELATSIDIFNEFALMTEEAVSYLKVIHIHHTTRRTRSMFVQCS